MTTEQREQIRAAISAALREINYNFDFSHEREQALKEALRTLDAVQPVTDADVMVAFEKKYAEIEPCRHLGRDEHGYRCDVVAKHYELWQAAWKVGIRGTVAVQPVTDCDPATNEAKKAAKAWFMAECYDVSAPRKSEEMAKIILDALSAPDARQAVKDLDAARDEFLNIIADAGDKFTEDVDGDADEYGRPIVSVTYSISDIDHHSFKSFLDALKIPSAGYMEGQKERLDKAISLDEIKPDAEKDGGGK